MIEGGAAGCCEAVVFNRNVSHFRGAASLRLNSNLSDACVNSALILLLLLPCWVSSN